MKIGLISDTHIPEAGNRLPHQVVEVFRGVDLILHAGDIHDLSVLDWLEAIAPVLAVRGNGDDGGGGRVKQPQDPRLKPVQMMNLCGFRLGLIHGLAYPYLPLERVFGEAVDIVVFGDTHVANIERKQGVLFVNPGSPTLPNNFRRELGTVGTLVLNSGQAEANIIQLR